ncbi:MAG: 4-hydroxy-3-methylbut-2-enyl diphosphate reductase [Candidatus Tectomicrobia bacterium]|nr:4-hydroxy-3-methylbut-2-enyl diphosphate reductase [Candidatus Tectomicrobia bacterium]
MALTGLVLAKPRGFCAGVERAIEIVSQALDVFGSPVYVRKEIVHNRHVVEALRQKGAVFVEEISEIPPGATAIFSAHGVAPSVWDAARAKQLHILDATCPLVTKVHLEVQRYAAEDYSIVLIGHADHDEVIGTRGEAPDRIQVVDSAEGVRHLTVPDPQKVVCLTQTTLSMDDTAEIMEALRKRFPAMTLPAREDICYATQNRQRAVKSMAGEVDLVLVIGATNSSNSNRLREVAETAGVRARLIQQVSDLEPGAFEGVKRVGVTSGASTPEFLVQEVVAHCRRLGVEQVQDLVVTEEHVKFMLPAELTGANQESP